MVAATLSPFADAFKNFVHYVYIGMQTQIHAEREREGGGGKEAFLRTRACSHIHSFNRE